MPNHYHLSVEEVHQIAYLTMHGWTLTLGEWGKPGFTETALEEAYWAQISYEERHAG